MSVVEWVADNWLALSGLILAVAGFLRAGRALRLSQAAVIVGEYHGLGIYGESGQLHYRVRVSNRGPGVAVNVRVVGGEGGTVEVADRLALDQSHTLGVEAGDIDNVRMEWRDGGEAADRRLD